MKPLVGQTPAVHWGSAALKFSPESSSASSPSTTTCSTQLVKIEEPIESECESERLEIVQVKVESVETEDMEIKSRHPSFGVVSQLDGQDDHSSDDDEMKDRSTTLKEAIIAGSTSGSTGGFVAGDEVMEVSVDGSRDSGIAQVRGVATSPEVVRSSGKGNVTSETSAQSSSTQPRPTRKRQLSTHSQDGDAKITPPPPKRYLMVQ